MQKNCLTIQGLTALNRRFFRFRLRQRMILRIVEPILTKSTMMRNSKIWLLIRESDSSEPGKI